MLLVERQDAVAVVTLNRPEAMNALSKALRAALQQALTELDADPSVIYAHLLDGTYSGTLHHSDMWINSPYNTYRYAGLPPGPIANPGAQSLAAALNPAGTPFLYFVAKATGGGHQFSATMAQHEKAVIAYRQASKHAGQRKIR